MEGKDDRMKGKRKKIKQYDRRGTHNQSSSSSQSKHGARSVIDIADSSDIEIFPLSSRQNRDYPPDIDTESNENAQLRAGDFKLLSELPTSIGGHFQFASEKNWDDGDEVLDNTEASEYFTLSVKLLNAGLKTIPFYKRMDYSASLFTNEQLVIMESSAEEAEKIYQNVLKEHLLLPKTKKSADASQRQNSAKSQGSTKPEQLQNTNVEGANDELDELLNSTANAVAQVNIKNTNDIPNTASNIINANNNNDDQQWLDDVLGN